jgi:hypothetical protein
MAHGRWLGKQALACFSRGPCFEVEKLQFAQGTRMYNVELTLDECRAVGSFSWSERPKVKVARPALFQSKPIGTANVEDVT